MVSFSCEGCGDILTKKKLDPHRNQCRGASFTCIDCMVHFQGTEYRSHTTCMTEAQKYEGALHKEKPAKNQRKGKNEPKQNSKANNNAQHRAPYVEEVPDVDDPKPTMHAPTVLTPPASNPRSSSTTTNMPKESNGDNVNVFDFLEPEKIPNASKVSLAEPKGQMRMVSHARSVFEPSKAMAPLNTEGDDENKAKAYDVAFEENGFSYGSDPIPLSQYPPGANVSTEFMTPAPKKKKDRSRKEQGSAATSEKKRKRRMEDVDMDDAEAQGEDTPMMDAPSSVQNHPGTPMLQHSGLTGGLNRMLRSPSVEGEKQKADPRRRYQEPVSPIKRSRRNDKEANNQEGGSMKSRAERFMSSMFGGSVVSASSGDTQPKALVRTRRSSSDDGRSKKTSKVRSSSNNQVVSSDPNKTKRKSSAQTDGDRPSRRQKQIEYRDAPRGGDDARDMVVYRQPNIPSEIQRDMAGHFMSLVTKGPESSRGFSVNKILKRFHKDYSGEYEDGLDREQRAEDEKELWRALRLKRNESGEIVVFF